jgi:hypothetical protein
MRNKYSEVRAYSYDAALHCPDCAYDRFGDGYNEADTVDSEGNSLGVVFDTDEIGTDSEDGKEYCDDCHEEL